MFYYPHANAPLTKLVILALRLPLRHPPFLSSFLLSCCRRLLTSSCLSFLLTFSCRIRFSSSSSSLISFPSFLPSSPSPPLLGGTGVLVDPPSVVVEPDGTSTGSGPWKFSPSLSSRRRAYRKREKKSIKTKSLDSRRQEKRQYHHPELLRTPAKKRTRKRSTSILLSFFLFLSPELKDTEVILVSLVYGSLDNFWWLQFLPLISPMYDILEDEAPVLTMKKKLLLSHRMYR